MVSGVKEDETLKPGKYTLRRRTKFASKENLRSSNTKVEFQMKLDLDISDYFKNLVKDKETESLQLLLNGKLRALMENELKLK